MCDANRAAQHAEERAIHFVDACHVQVGRLV